MGTYVRSTGPPAAEFSGGKRGQKDTEIAQFDSSFATLKHVVYGCWIAGVQNDVEEKCWWIRARNNRMSYFRYAKK